MSEPTSNPAGNPAGRPAPAEPGAARPEDRLFTRFRETRDPDLLSAVFDLTAPRLVRFALHLEGDLERAEELVQATFLVALEKAARWDADRPLLPWLLGILSAELKAAHRERARRPDPDRLVRSEPEEPDEEAQRAELWRTVQGVIEGLPARAREVLALRLREGLTSVQIARRLDISAGAARVRVHRGLERLRRRLPEGLAAPGLALLPESRGLEAVRAVVLARAGARPALLAAAAPPIVKVLAALAIVALVAIAWVLGQHLVRPAESTELASVERVPAAAIEESVAHDGGSAQRRPIVARTQDPPQPGPLRVDEHDEDEAGLGNREPRWTELRPWQGATPGSVIEGTVLDGLHPVEEGWAYLCTGRGATLSLIDDPTADVRRVALDADGGFRFDGLEPDTYTVAVRAGADQLQMRELRTGPTERRREVFVFFRSAVHGTVLDREGAPDTGAVVEARAVRDVVSSTLVTQTTTDAHGRYRLGGLLSGTYRVEVLGGRDRWDLSENLSVEIELEVAEARTIDFGRPTGLPVWTGRLVDGLGRPRGSFLEIHVEEVETGRTTAIDIGVDGVFEKALAPGTYRLTGYGYGGTRSFGEVEIGEHGLERDIQTPPALVTGRVRDPRRPADQGMATVWLTLVEAARPLPTDPPARSEACFLGERDTYAFHAVPPGRYRLHFAVGAVAGAPGGALELEIREEDSVLTFDLECERP